MRGAIQRIVADWAAPCLSRVVRPSHVRAAASALRDCRTAVYGGHAKRCEQGHLVGVWYNGCRHRSCPRCAWGKTQQWLAARAKELLSCEHFHVVFTVPSVLRPLWLSDPKRCADLLFTAVSRTLLELLANPSNLGVMPGITLALHTWSKSLALHPHIHALVTGGGMEPGGTWKRCRNGFLLPSRMMSRVYRGKLLSSLERAIRSGELRLPSQMERGAALELLREAAMQKWSVWVAERYEHGTGVMRYLARYMRGGPVRDSRIVSYDGSRVDLALRKGQQCRLTGREFVERLLQHVPTPNLRVIRHYGVYAHTRRVVREHCRAQVGESLHVLEPPEEHSSVSPTSPAPAVAAPELCPICSSRVLVEVIPRSGSPPRGRQCRAA